VEIYTIGFTQKSARAFFGSLTGAGIRRLIDVRLNNISQLAGFTKRDDLCYFLEAISGADYVHEPLLAPTAELLTAYRKHGLSWIEYERLFLRLMDERRVLECLPRALFDRPVVLLCSEPTATRCHRRLVAEYLESHWDDVTVHHL
jgi:uncharacterized protein (DUF488 family)